MAYVVVHPAPAACNRSVSPGLSWSIERAAYRRVIDAREPVREGNKNCSCT